MRKVFLTMAAVVALSSASFAQSGTTQIGIGPEVNFYTTKDMSDAFKLGIGGAVKGLFGIGTAGQVTGTVSYTSFKGKESTGDLSYSSSILGILAGYRHNFSGFYVEPQVGIGSYGSKVKYSGNSESESTSAFTYAAGLGYQVSGWDLGARYQAGTKDGETIGLFGIRVMKLFSLGGSGR